MSSSSWQVLVRYPFFRWYILTIICKDSKFTCTGIVRSEMHGVKDSLSPHSLISAVGDWLVRVSNLLVLQEWRGTGTAFSRLVFFSLIPKALLSPFGGLIADRFDRRHLMIALDGVAGFIVLGYLLAFYYKCKFCGCHGSRHAFPCFTHVVSLVLLFISCQIAICNNCIEKFHFGTSLPRVPWTRATQ